MSKSLQNKVGLLAGLITIAGFIVLGILPELAERLFGGVLFPFVRLLFDEIGGGLVFPLVYIVAPAMLLAFAIRLRKGSFRLKVLKSFNFVGWIITAFYFLWGFNYARPDLSSRLGLILPEVSESELTELGLRTANSLNHLRNQYPDSLLALNSRLEETCRKRVYEVLRDYGIEGSTKCRVRKIAPSGILRRLGIGGIYFPFTGEALVEKSHPWPELPFNVAHEFAHSMGIAREDEANLVAYLACASSNNPSLRYSAHLAMWTYLHSRYEYSGNTKGMAISGLLSEKIHRDLDFVRSEHAKYTGWLSRIGNYSNDIYLRIQGIDKGAESYDWLPDLYLQHKKATGT